ncbi:thioredoxin-domain-containing protein [Roridomyces roridus]|uniref:Thioredoxin-domain-containing protein n=1 Tax=Roridomyces roridus TaxID=1738132 RepID=A0AAD7CFT2_9AGAR|nr:thioredoxin-domain-containing protein [Roridomyces roridus]
MSTPLEIKSVKEWNETLRSATAAGMTVLVDFHATWCQPCKVIAPHFSRLASQNPHVRFLRVDVDAQQAIAHKYKVSAMPTFLALRSGQILGMVQGADAQGLARLVLQHGGPNPPVPPLPAEAEEAKVAGNAFYKEEKYTEAIEKYTAAIELAPTSAALLGNRSIAYLKSTPPDPDSALADAQKATEVEPKWGKGYVRLGEALQALERDEEAVKAFEKAIELSQGLAQTEAKKKLEAAKKKLGWH